MTENARAVSERSVIWATLLSVNRPDKKHRQKSQQQSHPQIKQLEFAPLVGTEDAAPLLANQVVVTGGTDTVTLTFYHISGHTLRRALPGPGGTAADVPGGHNIEFHGERVTVRSAPVATVALPLSVVADLMAEIVDTVVSGIPSLQESMVSFANRLTESIANATQSIQNAAGSADKSTNPSEGSGETAASSEPDTTSQATPEMPDE